MAIIHGMARMAALMASTYKAYLGVGLGPLSVRPLITSVLQQANERNLFAVIANILMMIEECNFYLLSWQFLTKYKIPHPGRVGGRFFIDIAMPLMLNWVLGGNR